eukprot:TRINITY_DN22769_c0_g1_i1.p2 TRINITY_DN22769_c0_g1~~TRINITY_DN22769_c0_g1_i1.p2  ORF type:complete len:569 (+),score=260.03 TRINITY_DN22769_c0_g1_i1:54-1709(+)
MQVGDTNEKTVIVRANINENNGDSSPADNNSAVGGVPVSDASSIYYATTPYRWVVLACVFFLNLVNAALWLTYSPIADSLATHFDVSTNSVNMLSLCLSATYGPVVWCAAPLVKKLGFGWSVRLAAALTGLGGVVRYFGTDHSTFWLLVVGQVLSGLARPFISQLLGMVSLKWFANHQRVLATAIAALGNPFGIGLGMGLSPLIVKSDDDESSIGDEIKKLNLIHMIIAVAMLLFVFLCIRERPKHDPSEAAIADRLQENPIAFTSEVKLLWNRNYWLCAFAFGFGFGQINCIAVIISQIMKPFGYNSSTVGMAGVMTILPGVIGAGAVAAFLGKRPFHREALIAIYFAAAVLLQIMMLVALRKDAEDHQSSYKAKLLASAGLFGFFSQPCFSVALELAAETVYPASPSVASAGVVMMGQYIGLIMSLSLGHYIGSVDNSSHTPSPASFPTPVPTPIPQSTLDQQSRVHVAGYIQSGSFVVAGLLMLLFKKDSLARMQYETEQKAKKKAAKNEEKRRLREEERRSKQYSTLNESGAAVVSENRPNPSEEDA